MQCKCEGITCECGIPCSFVSRTESILRPCSCGCTDCKNSPAHPCQLCRRPIAQGPSREKTCSCFLSKPPSPTKNRRRSVPPSLRLTLRNEPIQMDSTRAREYTRIRQGCDSRQELENDVVTDRDTSSNQGLGVNVITGQSRTNQVTFNNSNSFDPNRAFHMNRIRPYARPVLNNMDIECQQRLQMPGEQSRPIYGAGCMPEFRYQTCQGKLVYPLICTPPQYCPTIVQPLIHVVPTTCSGVIAERNVCINAVNSGPPSASSNTVVNDNFNLSPEEQIEEEGTEIRSGILRYLETDIRRHKEGFIVDWLNKTKKCAFDYL